MNTVLITEINCLMLYPSFLISVIFFTLEQFLIRQTGLIKFYAEDKNKFGSRTNVRP
jgi:hypothetical protein